QLRFGDGSAAAFRKLGQDIIRLKLEVVIASTNQHIAAKAATTTIPIVMVYAADPVGQKYVESLAHPGGNITGLAGVPGPDIRAKLVEVLAECRPGLSRIRGLLDPRYPGYRISWAHVEAGARILGIATR